MIPLKEWIATVNDIKIKRCWKKKEKDAHILVWTTRLDFNTHGSMVYFMLWHQPLAKKSRYKGKTYIVWVSVKATMRLSPFSQKWTARQMYGWKLDAWGVIRVKILTKSDRKDYNPEHSTMLKQTYLKTRPVDNQHPRLRASRNSYRKRGLRPVRHELLQPWQSRKPVVEGDNWVYILEHTQKSAYRLSRLSVYWDWPRPRANGKSGPVFIVVTIIAKLYPTDGCHRACKRDIDFLKRASCSQAP